MIHTEPGRRIRSGLLFLILFSGLFVCNILAAQVSIKLDSMLLRLKNVQVKDTARVNLLNNLAWEYQFSDPNEGIRMAEQSLQISTQINYQKGKSEAYLGFGVCYAVQSNIDKALDNYSKALIISESIGEKGLSATINLNIGNIYFTKADFSKTMEYYNMALKSLEEIKDISRCASVYGNMGNVYYVQGKYTKSLDYQFKSLKLAQESNNLKVQGNSLAGIGNIYSKMPDYPKALEYYYKSLKIHEQTGNRKAMAGSYGSIGIVYYRQKAYSRALEKFDIARKISESIGDKRNTATTFTNIGNVYADLGENVKALENLQNALNLFTQINFQSNIASTLNNMARVNTKLNNYSEALLQYNEAYKRNTELGIKSGAMYSLIGLGGVYLSQVINADDPESKPGKSLPRPVHREFLLKSIQYTKNALVIGRELNELDPMIEAYANIAQASQLLGDWQNAYLYLDSTHTLQDSVFNLEKQQKISDIEAKRVAELNAQKTKIDLLVIRNQRIALALVSVGLILMAVLAIVIYRSLMHKKRYNKLLESEVGLRTFELRLSNERLQKAKEELEVLDLAKSEFLQIIHHEIRTPLNGVIGPVDILKQSDNPELIRKMIRMIDVSVHRLEHFSLKTLAIAEIRAKGSDIFDFKKVDLKEVVDKVTQQFNADLQKNNLTIRLIHDTQHYFVHADGRFIADCVRNILENAIKHAPAGSEININLLSSGERVLCTIADKGNGFPDKLLNTHPMPFIVEKHTDSNAGLGLYYTSLVLEAHKGELVLGNMPGGGAYVTIHLPELVEEN